MMFISKNDEFQINIKKKSVFLVGEIDYDIIEKSNRFYSHSNVGLKIRKRNTLDSNHSPERFMQRNTDN